jgi:hypothetical protein
LRILFFFFALLLIGNAVRAQTVLPAYVPPAGLVGWWPFTGNAGDSSGRGNHGTSNSAVLAPDRFGVANAAYVFGGDSSYIEVRDTNSLQVRLLTMSVWVKPDVFGRRQQLIYKGRKTDAYGEGYYLQTAGEAGIKISGGCQPNVGWRLSYFNPQGLPAGVWTHLCSTYDGLYIRNYVNGEQSDANPITGQIDLCQGANLRFGYGQDLYPGPRPFKGSLDEIGLWNRALTPAEVKALYTGSRVPAGVTASLSEEAFTLYPNPVRGTAFLRYTGAGGSFKVQVTDILGRHILEESFAGGGYVQPLHIAGPTGLYLIVVRNRSGSIVFEKKLLME